MSDTANPKDAIGAKKVNLALVPPASIIHEATAMENGAEKYGPFNWREKKVRATVYIAAALRHLLEYLDGADFSSDTSPPVHHLAHAKACCGIVLDALETGNLVDDRPVVGAASRLVARGTTLDKQKPREWPVELKRKLAEAWFSPNQDVVAEGLNALATETECGKPGCKEHIANLPPKRFTT